MRFLSFRWPRRISLLACGTLGFLMPMIFGLWFGIPEPAVHDEFAYLLGADTFAHGRLSNPAPELPEFFESPHVIVSPTYASKYPPAQFIALGIGQVLGGHPIWGVWLSCGLFAAALCWMLQSSSSPRWALAVTIIAIATRGVSSYWAQSYWGGMVAATGSALLLGGVVRTLRAPRTSSSSLMGLGLIILANSRPYEGAVLSLIVGLVLAWWFVANQRVPLHAKLLRCVVPCGVVLILGAVWMAVYNRAVTSSAVVSPYMLNSRQYLGQSLFLFSEPYELERHAHPRITAYFATQRNQPEHGRRLWSHMFQNFLTRSQRSLEAALTLTSSSAYEGEVKKTVLWLTLFALIPLFRSRLAMFYGVAFLGFTAGQSLVRFWLPHYAAPAAPLILALAAIGFRQISLPIGQWRRARLAPFVVAALAIVSVTLPAVREAMEGRPGPAQRVRSLNRDYVDLIAARDAVVAELDREPGKKLVFVAYDPSFDTQYEWVYNPADLGSSNILFVHDLGDERNRQLMRLQSDRVAWIARVRNERATVTRYVPAI